MRRYVVEGMDFPGFVLCDVAERLYNGNPLSRLLKKPQITNYFGSEESIWGFETNIKMNLDELGVQIREINPRAVIREYAEPAFKEYVATHKLTTKIPSHLSADIFWEL